MLQLNPKEFPVAKTKKTVARKQKAVTKVVKKTVAQSVKLEFTINEMGMLAVSLRAPKTADERLVQAAAAAHKLFFNKSVEGGGVPVKIGDQVIVADRFKGL